jgi:Fe(3+) dicitrate transport protein
MKNALSIGLCLLTTSLFAQEINPILNDTVKNLLPVIVTGKIQSPERMPEVKENVLFSGKKNEILKLSNINGTLLQIMRVKFF